MTNDFGSVNFIVKQPFFNWCFFMYVCETDRRKEGGEKILILENIKVSSNEKC